MEKYQKEAERERQQLEEQAAIHEERERKARVKLERKLAEENKKDLEQQRKKDLQQRKKDLARLVVRYIETKAPALALKRRQLLIKDEYGKTDRRAWDAEVDRFIDEVLPKRLQNRLPRQEIRKAITAAVNLQPVAKMPINAQPGRALEQFVRDAFLRAKWTVRPLPGSGDQGVDVLATKGEMTLAVQCKDYSGSVGNAAVQEVATGRLFYDATIAAVVSPAPFTVAARRLAASASVTLLSPDGLEEFIDGCDGATGGRSKRQQRSRAQL